MISFHDAALSGLGILGSIILIASSFMIVVCALLFSEMFLDFFIKKSNNPFILTLIAIFAAFCGYACLKASGWL